MLINVLQINLIYEIHDLLRKTYHLALIRIA
jgi:hypothetical protein